MLDAVFISDLHLHPHDKAILARFYAFVDWAKAHTKAVYILGDFLHVADGLELEQAWLEPIKEACLTLVSANIQLYFMHGNRDFLISDAFIHSSGMTLLKEPTTLEWGEDRILLLHGDGWCTNDKWHMWFRWLTRRPLFITLFTQLPKWIRKKLVNKTRQYSASTHQMVTDKAMIDERCLLHAKDRYQPSVIIHGHIHQPLKKIYSNFTYYVLGDWDDNPWVLCYDKSNGFYLNQLMLGEYNGRSKKQRYAVDRRSE
jgi:UDP-2,3-diacylglucosamine hydrolase